MGGHRREMLSERRRLQDLVSVEVQATAPDDWTADDLLSQAARNTGSQIQAPWRPPNPAYRPDCTCGVDATCASDCSSNVVKTATFVIS